MLRFASGTDPRVLATLAKIESHLSSGWLIHRYDTSTGPDGEDKVDIVDGVGGLEGAFTICTFWYVENLARAGLRRLAWPSKIRLHTRTRSDYSANKSVLQAKH
jgi:GH15 family glucan-1,4-alpha-glucosidase